MKKKTLEPYLQDKRNEIIWALVKQGYNSAQLSRMFNMNRSYMFTIVQDMPKDYKIKWVKVRN